MFVHDAKVNSVQRYANVFVSEHSSVQVCLNGIFFKVSGTKTKGYSSKLTWKKKQNPRGSMPLGRKLANGISTQTGLLFPDCVPKQHNDALD